ncbi:unnamed protein product [Toxocara canis]|uniref:DUF1985 domain-containing protein n=1 Tax=Toxocara canis TaxID=6265 RepID=A0A183U605_TOXCA|nr:unnamed protein product [Toxocara canis]
MRFWLSEVFGERWIEFIVLLLAMLSSARTDAWINIDMSSARAVLNELLYGEPVFSGRYGLKQLIALIRVLGTSSRKEILEMNPHYIEQKISVVKQFLIAFSIYQVSGMPNSKDYFLLSDIPLISYGNLSEVVDCPTDTPFPTDVTVDELPSDANPLPILCPHLFRDTLYSRLQSIAPPHQRPFTGPHWFRELYTPD